MAGVSETRQYDALLSTTMAAYYKQMYDNIFDNYPLISWLNGKLGRNITRKNTRDVKMVKTGGETIVAPLMYAENTTAASLSGAEVYDTTPQEGMTIARYNWKKYVVSTSIIGDDRRANRDEAQIVSLLKSKVMQAEKSLQKLLNEDANGDGTNNGGKSLTGLLAHLTPTTTTGGLAPATYAWWAAVQKAAVGSFAANGVQNMKVLMNDLTYGSDAPDIMFCAQEVHEYYETSLGSVQRIIDQKAADMGFENLVYKGVPLIFDRDHTAGASSMLNSNYINWCVMKDADLAVSDFKTIIDQDVTTSSTLLQANITVTNRRMLGSMIGITA